MNYCKLLDELLCDVIIKPYIEQVGTTEIVYVVREGLTYRYDDLVSNVTIICPDLGTRETLKSIGTDKTEQEIILESIHSTICTD